MTRPAIVKFLAVNRAFLPTAAPMAATERTTNTGSGDCRLSANRFTRLATSCFRTQDTLRDYVCSITGRSCRTNWHWFVTR